MKRVVLCRAATVTALGADLEQLWQGLMAGQSAVAPVRRFDCSGYSSRLAATIDGLKASPEGSLLDGLLERIAAQLVPLPSNTRLLLASTKGEIDRLEQARRTGQRIPQAILFEPLLAKVAQRFGLKDQGCNVNAACASSTIALARGAALIAQGQADAVLVYAADLVSEFVFSGFSALQALSAESCRPFDAQRKGLNLGEAAAGLLLMSEAAAIRSGETPLAILAGWGAANDAHHVTAPARDGFGLLTACRKALGQAKIVPAQIGAINAHGTGTLYNDAMELTAFDTLFAGELPPLHGVKGSLGHCLGAAGAVEVAIASRALCAGEIPGTVGCLNPEAGAGGAVNSSPQALTGDYLLCTNSGFGGVNGVVILQRIDR